VRLRNRKYKRVFFYGTFFFLNINKDRIFFFYE